MTILLTLVMNSLHKYYCDIAVIMTGFGFTKLTAHFLRYLDSQKKSKFQENPNFKGSEFEEIKCSIVIQLSMRALPRMEFFCCVSLSYTSWLDVVHN